MAQETSAPRTTDTGPHQGSGEQESTADPPGRGRSAGRVPIDRLLSVAVLTPAQASFVAVQLLDATQAADPADGKCPADACLWAVSLTPSGQVDVARAQAGEGARFAELLEQLSHNARRLPAHPRADQLLLLRRLEEVAAAPQLAPGSRARELELALAEVLGPGAPERLSGQLAALSDAFTRIAPSVRRTAPDDALAAAGRGRHDPQRAAPARPLPSRPPRRGQTLSRPRARTRRMVLVALLLGAVLVGSGYVMLQGPDTGAADLDDQPGAPSATAPPDSSKQPSNQPRQEPGRAVTTLADRSAGPITGVAVQRTGSCTPGAACPVTVTVRFSPASTTRPVVWKVGVARLCGSGITWSQPVTVTAQPGWTRVYASSSIAVPRGRSLALVALTTAPARAQSPPVPVTGSSLRC